MRVALILIAVVLVLVVYGSWAARRLDRLHARIDATRAGLDSQLRVRAEAAAALARSVGVPPALAPQLAEAAAAAHAAQGLGHNREIAESHLSGLLQEWAAALRTPTVEALQVVDAATRTSFARQFHNDSVRDALIVRRRWVIRLAHLAGHAPLPTYFEMDDAQLVIATTARSAAPYD